MAFADLPFFIETTIATRAYRKFIREGYTHYETCYQLDTMILPKLQNHLSKSAFHEIVDRIRREPNLSRWHKHPSNRGCERP
jgi:hypothetical protein